MNALTDRIAARPWYREPWPWILMAGPCAVIVASMFTLWLAIGSDDGLVADDYYKRGLAINRTLARAQAAQRLGLSARVTLDARASHVRVLLDGAGALPAALRVRFTHPTRAVSDRVAELRAVGAGVYEGDLAAPVAGRRVLLLEDAARTWRLTAETDDVAAHAVTLSAGK